MRDPYSRLGGVASGFAHYYGLDVSLVRILFVVFAFMTGFGFLVYLLAWLVIPRATHWPPAGAPQSLRSLSGRDLAIGIVLIGLLFTFGVGSGGPAQSVLVPLLLVGGGVWLLSQRPQAPSVPSGVPGPPVAPGPSGVPGPSGAQPAPGPAGDDGLSEAADVANLGIGDDTATGGSATQAGPFASPGPGGAHGPGGGHGAGGGHDAGGGHGAPVPPRSRRRFAPLLLILAVVLFVLTIPVLIVGGLVAGVATGAIDLDIEQSAVEVTPATVADIPESIVRGGAEVVIDLTSLEAADFAELDDPVLLETRLDVGSIRVIVPDDIAVSVDADADIGSVSVFDQTDDGFGVGRRSSPEGDPDLELDLEVDIGEIIVQQG